MILVIGGANDILATTFHWSLQATTWVLRFLLIALPPIAFKLTKRFCLGLQHHDEALLHHGIETGIIRRLPHGEYIEVEEPVPAAKAEVLAAQIGYDLHAGHHAPALGVGGTNGHGPSGPSSNGHGSSTTATGAASDAGDATTNAAIKRPVALKEKARLKLEAFYLGARESVPDAHGDDDSPASSY
jgi:hypothetical protein